MWPQGLTNYNFLANSGLFTDTMKQEAEKQAHSLLNNNTSIFPNMIAPPGTSSLQLHQQMYMNLLAANLPILAANSSLYQQPLNWSLPVVSSPSPTSHHSSERISPVRNNLKYTSANSQKTTSNNNNSSTNNNNVVSSSADRITKRAQALKRKPSVDHQMNNKSIASPASVDRNSPATLEATTKDTRDRNFQCKVCSRSFGYKHVLQNHERTHTGEKPFECPECHKRFTRDHHLKTHLRLHTGEKPYNCDHCHRKFVQVANLRRHLRVHTGERPYICEVCQAKFSDSNQLKAHKLIHEEEKPHKCRHCDMRFFRKSQLSGHKCSLKITAGTRSPPLSSITDLKVEVDFEMADKSVSMRHDLLRTLSSPVALNLAGGMHRGLVTDIPEQTEPEDLSMSTGMHRPYSRTHSNGDSPLSLSPSIDADRDDQLEMSQDSPNSQIIQ